MQFCTNLSIILLLLVHCVSRDNDHVLEVAKSCVCYLLMIIAFNVLFVFFVTCS